MENFIQENAVYAMLVVMIVEYLIGASKLKSNSTIEMVVSIIKFIFGKKEEQLELPKK